MYNAVRCIKHRALQRESRGGIALQLENLHCTVPSAEKVEVWGRGTVYLLARQTDYQQIPFVSKTTVM
jgi:hypothetical protein